MATLDISFKPERAHLRKPKRSSNAERVVPQSVSGRYRRLKWIALIACLAVYYVLPFIRWARGPGQPDQSVLLDLERGRLYFFFVEIWPQEVYYLTGLKVFGAVATVTSAFFESHDRVWASGDPKTMAWWATQPSPRRRRTATRSASSPPRSACSIGRG